MSVEILKRNKGDVKAMLRKYLKPGDIAIDVGAGVGEMTAIMAECVGPTGHVYAFEPAEVKRAAIEKAISQYDNVTLTILGIGECSGQMPLHRAQSTHASRWHGDEKTSPISVPMEPLDALIATADLVKIDTQGSESHILEGAPHLLGICPIWILELWPWGLQTAGRTATEVLGQLRAAGLTPHWSEGDPMSDGELLSYSQESRHWNILAKR